MLSINLWPHCWEVVVLGAIDSTAGAADAAVAAVARHYFRADMTVDAVSCSDIVVIVLILLLLLLFAAARDRRRAHRMLIMRPYCCHRDE
jgi:branched-subunit amino acid ABC-type transport system permease component